MTNKILVGFDLSKHAIEALRYGGMLAENLNAELIVVNIINQRDITAMEHAITKIRNQIDNFPVTIGNYIEGIKKDRSDKIKEIIKQNGLEKISFRCMIEAGVPFKRLVELADKEKPGLVVIGAKGRSDLADVIVGSTASKMFRHCPYPLLSVRLHNNESEGRIE